MLKQGVPVSNNSSRAGNTHQDVYMTAIQVSDKHLRGGFLFSATEGTNGTEIFILYSDFFPAFSGLKKDMIFIPIVLRVFLEELFKCFIAQSSIFDYSFERIRIEPFMVWDRNPVNAIRHADMFAAGYDYEADFTKRPYCSFHGNIGKEHFRRRPQLDIQWNPVFPLQSSGGRF
jgi:hypothetical protein